MYYRYEARQFPETFFYLRTPRAVEHSDDAFEALYREWHQQGWPEQISLLTPMDGGTWEDGVVLGLHTTTHPTDIARAIRPALDKFDAWALLNTSRQWAEWTGSGPVSAYFDPNAVFGVAPPTAQLFLGFDDSERIPEPAVDVIRNVYGRGKCVPVFHFRDGRILLINTRDPARTIRSRLANAARRIDYLCGCDASGEPFSKDDDPVWEDSFIDLSFSAPEDETETPSNASTIGVTYRG